MLKCPGMFAPGHAELDVTNNEAVWRLLKLCRPRVVIHSAALVGRAECQDNKEQAEQVNICGTRNFMLACKEFKAKLVFISTAAVFDGNQGNYVEDDKPNPQYFYAQTKLFAETIVRELEDHLIIRTDFFDPTSFKYDQVYSDHYCSKEPTAIIAKKILAAIDAGATGVKHIGGPRRVLYEILRPFFPSIRPIKIENSSMPDFPRDLSLASKLTG